jgi:hypothetical protein
VEQAFPGCLELLQSAASTNASRRPSQTPAGSHPGRIVKSTLNILPLGKYRTYPPGQAKIINIFYVSAITDRQGRLVKDKIAEGHQLKTIHIQSAGLIFSMVGAGSSTARATGTYLGQTAPSNFTQFIQPKIISVIEPV